MGKRRFFPVLGLVSTMLLGCSNQDPVDNVLPSKTQVCGGQAIEGQYLVQMQDDQVVTVKDNDFEHFKEKVLRPQIARVKRVEYDQKFEPQEVSPSAVTSINNWAYRAINVESMWQNGIRGNNVVVAVVDSGVDVTHPILANRIFKNSGEAGLLSNNGVDDDHNGYVDDYNGYSFYDNSPNLTDNVVHGTHVAGVIAGEHSHNNVVDDELLGVAPGARILPVKFIDESGGTLGDAVEAIEYAVNRGAKIINASWGGSGCSEILRNQVAGLAARGVLFVAAAGNNGRNLDLSPEYPAALNSPMQITVGAISPFLGMTSFSNYSSSLVHIFAPGQDITSSAPGGGSVSLSGTSMAAPFVAGAAALIWSARPNLTVAEVRQILLNSVATHNSYNNATHGRVDLAIAVNQIQ